MNKKDYISAVDKIKAPDSLVEKIGELEQPDKKKTPMWKKVTAIAACFVAVVIAFSGTMGTAFKAESEDNGTVGNRYDMLADGFSDDAGDSIVSQSATGSSGSSINVTADRKIIKSGSIGIRTKNYDTFITALNQKITQYGGYIESSQEYNYGGTANRNAAMSVRIPADKLDAFINELSVIGTVVSKEISSSDITDSYIATESRIKALETEEKTLLGLLEKAGSLTDVIQLQDRLSEIRSELESLKNQKKSYDSQVSYSSLMLDISEVERVVEGGDSFFGEVKERLLNNLYDLGDFFTELAINLIAAVPYIAIAGIVVAVVIIIIKKVKKR